LVLVELRARSVFAGGRGADNGDQGLIDGSKTTRIVDQLANLG
jgi:hypothetical protein